MNNSSSDQINRSSPNRTGLNDSLGRETFFNSNNITPNFFPSNPHQKKRDLNQIQNVCGENLHVLENNPQKEIFKVKPLTPIIRNTYESRPAAGKSTQRVHSPVLNFHIESADFHEEKHEKNGFRKVFKEKVGMESGNAKDIEKPSVPPQKAKRVEKIMDSDNMRQTLKSREEFVAEEKGIAKEELISAARENVKNNKNTPYKFKHSVDKKHAFYVN